MKELIFCIVTFIYSPCWAQVKLTYKLEGGINSSTFPKKIGKERIKSVYSPSVGFYITSEFSKRFVFDFGVQYYIQGFKEEYSSRVFDQINGTYLTVDEREQMTFNVITIPISFRYNFHIGNIKLNSFIGYSHVNLVSGSYYYMVQAKHDIDLGRNIFIEKSFTPFSKDLEVPSRRNNSQLICGIGIQLSKRVEFCFKVSPGIKIISFREKRPPYPGWDLQNDYHQFLPNDLGVTVRYNLN